MRFSGAYGVAALLLFGVEVLIALFVHDDFVRPYVGDVLVVILLYCLVMTFVALPKWSALLGVLVFACSLEVAQYFQLVTLLGLQDLKAARIIIGTTYSFEDLAAYAGGTVIAGGVERFCDARRARRAASAGLVR